MGRASDLAAELCVIQAAMDKSSQATVDGYRVIGENADGLWETFSSCVVSQVQEFADAWPRGKECGLSAKRLNPNNLTVRTIVLPMLKLEVIYTPKRCVSCELTEQFTARSLPEISVRREFRFTTDRQLQPYFTDGRRYLTVQQFADELIEMVGDFFKRAQEAPSILS